MAASSRPLVSIQTLESDMSTDGPNSLPLPDVMKSSIRPDLVSFVHSKLSNNSRQPYAISRKAGHQTSAESWGTGRANSRIPRVPGGGTHRAGQGAFGNMCRGGRMFAPTRIWRNWHCRINLNLKRFAVASAIAASSVPSLVMARGHKIESVPELPLVISDYAESVKKTSKAIKVLKEVGAYPDAAEKAKDSIGLRPGKGKMRNRRYICPKGPLIVYGTEGAKLVKAFRNIPGIEIANVERLNLLKLAPGGHLGRFVIWTKSAFEKLDSIYGSFGKTYEKKKYVLPRSKMVNADLARIINSDEIQSVVRPIKKEVKRATLKKNPLQNLNTMLRLNPYAKTARRMSLLAEAQRCKSKKEKLDQKRTSVMMEHVPVSCITEALSFLSSPSDVGRASKVSKLFNRAADSDKIWNNFLPGDINKILERSAAPLNCASKRQLFSLLCNSYIMLDNGLSFSLDKSGKKCFMLGARQLSLRNSAWDPTWIWASNYRSRFAEVAVLRGILCDARCNFRIGILSRHTTYGAYLVYRLLKRAAFAHALATIRRASQTKHEASSTTIYPNPNFKRTVQDGDVVSRMSKKDKKWLEIKTGEIETGGGDDDDEVEIRIYRNFSSGVVIQGIEFRPLS